MRLPVPPQRRNLAGADIRLEIYPGNILGDPAVLYRSVPVDDLPAASLRNRHIRRLGSGDPGVYLYPQVRSLVAKSDDSPFAEKRD